MPVLHAVDSQALRALLASAMLLAACPAETPPDEQTPQTRSGPPRPGIRFDASTLRSGDRVGTLVVESIDARLTPIDSSHVGTARFRGEVELTGATMRHPDADERSRLVCFEADTASAARLPRWPGDERRPWFCFDNQADARRALGPPSDGVRARIVIDRFTIHRGFSDEVNGARLARTGAAP